MWFLFIYLFIFPLLAVKELFAGHEIHPCLHSPSERHSVALDQSAEGVRCSKLALITANPSSSRFILPAPLHTRDESVSRVSALPRRALLQRSGSGWRPIGSRLHSGGSPTPPYNWLLAWQAVTGRDAHMWGESARYPQTSPWAHFTPISSRFMFSLLNFSAPQKQISRPPAPPSHRGGRDVGKLARQSRTQHLLGELNLKMSSCTVDAAQGCFQARCKIECSPHAEKLKRRKTGIMIRAVLRRGISSQPTM